MPCIASNIPFSFKPYLEVTTEVKATLQLAVPLVISQILEGSINLVDAAMIGWLGSQSLAAGALGIVTFSALTLVCSCSLSRLGVIRPILNINTSNSF